LNSRQRGAGRLDGGERHAGPLRRRLRVAGSLSDRSGAASGLESRPGAGGKFRCRWGKWNLLFVPRQFRYRRMDVSKLLVAQFGSAATAQ